MIWIWLACTAPTEPEWVFDAGELGPFGVATTTFTAARATGRTFEVDVHLPLDPDGELAADEAPVLVLVQGGAVEDDRYHWLAQDLAAQGFVLLTPEYPNDLAIFGSNRSFAALQDARALSDEGDPVLGGTMSPDTAGILGHSLGGVVAAKQWVRHDDTFGALALLASYAANGDAVEDRSAPVLSITGARDGSAALSDVQAGAERFQDATLAVVEGMNHYDWCDDVTSEEADKEASEHARPTAESRADAVAVLHAYFGATLLDDPDAQAALDQGDFAGVEILE